MRFSLQRRRTFKYPADLRQWEEELKAAKKLAEAQKTAVLSSQSISVVCKLPK